MGRWMKKIKNKQYGQAMVEFALTLPIFLLAVIGVIELSRFFLVYSSVYTASREAARFGSSVGEDGILHYLDCDGIKKVAADMGSFGGVNDADPNKIDIYYESSPGVIRGNCGDFIKDNIILGDRLIVDISVAYKPLLVDLVLPDGIMVSAKNGRTIMKEIELDTTPIPIPLCQDDLMFGGTLSTEPNNKTYTVIVKNVSSTAKYQLSEANIIAFNDKKELQRILWNGVIVWENTGGDEFPEIDPKSWEEVEDAEGNIVFSRLLSSEQSVPVSFEFAKVINKSQLGLQFNLTYQNSSILTKRCTLSWP